MRELRQRVGLVHDLRKFAAAEEVLDGRGNAFGINQCARRHILLFTNRHALLHGAAQLEESFAQFIGGQLVNGSNTPVAQMVNIVDMPFAQPELQDVPNRVQIIERVQRHFRFVDILVELAVDAETAHFAEAVSVRIEKFFLEQLARLFKLGRVAGTQTLVDFEQRFLVRAGRILVERGQDQWVLNFAQHSHFAERAGIDLVHLFRRQCGAAVSENFAGFGIDHISHNDGAYETLAVGRRHLALFGRVERLEDVGIA